jgi:hypothetical protein
VSKTVAKKLDSQLGKGRTKEEIELIIKLQLDDAEADAVFGLLPESPPKKVGAK